MKQLILSICAFLIFVQNFAQTNNSENIKQVDSKIDEVIVFLNGAQVVRRQTVNLPKGESKLIFKNLAADMFYQSIRLNASNDVKIISVGQQESDDDLELITDLKKLQKKLAITKANLSVNDESQKLLIANEKIGGTAAPLTITNLQQMSDYFAKQLTALKVENLNLRDSITKIEKQIADLKNMFAGQRSTNCVVAIVNAPQAGKVDFELTYVVRNARWQPVYDVRATNISSPIELSYKAMVSQNSENWQNVNLKFSSANPSLNGTAPNLYPKFLYPKYTGRLAAVACNKSVESPVLEEVEVCDMEALADVEDYAFTSNTNQTSIEFAAKTKYSIKKGDSNVSIDLNSYQLVAQFQYYLVPKLSSNAYLKAFVTDWEKYNLLDGKVNVFFENTFIGESNIKIGNADTLEFSLGIDKNISMSRQKVGDYVSKKIIGSRKEEARAWQIDIRNNKSENIEMLVLDQIPLSTSSEIEVSTIELSGANFDDKSGKVQWKLNLQPSERKSLILKYSVKYPKSMELDID